MGRENNSAHSALFASRKSLAKKTCDISFGMKDSDYPENVVFNLQDEEIGIFCPETNVILSKVTAPMAGVGPLLQMR